MSNIVETMKEWLPAVGKGLLYLGLGVVAVGAAGLAYVEAVRHGMVPMNPGDVLPHSPEDGASIQHLGQAALAMIRS